MDNIKQTFTNTYNNVSNGIKNKYNTLMNPSNTTFTSGNNISLNNSKINTVSNSGVSNSGVSNNNNTPQSSSAFVLVVAGFIVFILLLVLYFLSKTFRVNKAVDSHKIYQNYNTIQSIPYENKGVQKLRLSDTYVASSYNTALVGYQMLDYVSPEIVKETLKSGCRFIEFNIFNSEYGEDALPVVSNGYRNGEWKMTAGTVLFEDCIKEIDKNAFVVGDGDNGVPNPDDPIFISLNLHTNNNLHCLDVISDIIVDYFRDRLLDNKYSYQQSEIADITMAELQGRVCIFSSEGFEGSKLDEVVNYSWGMKGMRRMHYNELEEADARQTQAFNKRGITIVVPHKEGDILTENYDPQRAWDLGCQFVLMSWTSIDEHMDKYITKFRNNSIIAKPKKLRKKVEKKKTTTNNTEN